MRNSKLFLILLLAALAMTGVRALCQASVSENEAATLYVSKSGSTNASAAGTSSAPLGSIQAAVNRANVNSQKGIGTKIIVAPGVYREALTINAASSSAPLTIQASSIGTAVIAGSDVLTGWSSVSGHPNTYYHSWTYNFGNCPTPNGWPGTFPTIARRSEMIFVNNVMYTQVLSESQLKAGTFYVDEAANHILVTLPSGMSANGATIEAAVRSETLEVNHRNNFVLRGVVLRHARTCINQGGADINSSTNVLVDHVQAIWNGWGGLQFNHDTKLTVQNSIASHNGGVGFTANNGVNTLFSYNETDFNNWRGAQGALYDWGMGGTKMMYMRSTTVQHHYSYGNQAQGLWFDTDNKNITVNSVTVSGSAESALQLEANEGPILVEYSHFCGSLAGVNFLNSDHVTLKSNTFYNNGSFGVYTPAGIFLAGRKGGHVIYDWQTHQYYNLYTANTVMTGNTDVDAASGQHVFSTYLSGYDWSHFADTLSASSNRWYDPYTTYAFKVVNGKTVNLSGWRSAVGTDYSASWGAPSSSPAGACAIPSQSFTDFQISLNQESYSMSSRKATIMAKVASFGYGTIYLSTSGLPSGVSASMNHSSITNGIVTITLTASSSASNRTVPITFWATSGSRVHSVTTNVHIVP
jgi:hypothetical protein